MSLTTKKHPAYKLVNGSKMYHWNGHPVEMKVVVNGLHFHAKPGEQHYVDFLLGDEDHRLIARTDDFGDNHIVLVAKRPDAIKLYLDQVNELVLPPDHELLHFLFVDGKSLAEYPL